MMRIPIPRAHVVATIPTAGKEIDSLLLLLGSLRQAHIPVLVHVDPDLVDCDDIVSYTSHFGGIEVEAVPGRNIYQAWNDGLDWAVSKKASLCHVLNDDAYIAPSDFDLMEKRMLANQTVWVGGFDYDRKQVQRCRFVRGSYRLHGVGGFAFCVRPEIPVRFDTEFTWWGGDDDFFWSVDRSGGRCAVFEGIPVIHPPGGNTTNRHFDMSEGLARDRARLFEKWGQTW